MNHTFREFGTLNYTKDILPTPSEEQQLILDSVSSGKNVRIEADAGTSKTTTLLMLAYYAPKMKGNYLILCYGKVLQQDTEKRIMKMSLEDKIQCRTFHSFAGICFGNNVYNDTIMEDLLWKAREGKQHIKYPDANTTFLIDEAQDIKYSYYEFLKEVMSHHRHQMVIVGDVRQKIYTDTSSEYLSKAEEYFCDCTSEPWTSCTLKISYRMTPNICSFVNVLWENNTLPGNYESENLPVEYLLVPSYESKKKLKSKVQLKIPSLSFRVKQLIEEYGVNNLILLSSSPNTKEHVPFKDVVNTLKEYNFHLRTDGNTEHNKVRIWSYQASKGMTVRCVVVLGFSAYNGMQPDKNAIAVACSRSCEKLVVVDQRDIKKGYFEFDDGYDGNKCSNYVEPFDNQTLYNLIQSGTVIAPNGLPKDTNNKIIRKSKPIYVTELIKICQNPERYLRYMSYKVLQEPENKLSYSSSCDFKSNELEIKQNVSSLYGIAVPYKLEFLCTSKIKDVEEMLNPVFIPKMQYKKESISNKRYFLKNMKTKNNGKFCFTELELDVFDICDENITETSFLQFIELNINKFASLKSFGITTTNNYDDNFLHQHYQRVKEIYKKLTEHGIETIRNFELIYLANASQAFKNDVKHNLNQITHYDWVDSSSIDNGCDFFKSWIGSADCEFETRISYEFNKPKNGKIFNYTGICGKIDARNQNFLYEFKMVDKLTIEHKFQATLYAAMWCIHENIDETKIQLLNGKTKEAIELCIQISDAELFIQDISNTLETNS
jgi:hypothetical protein